MFLPPDWSHSAAQTLVMAVTKRRIGRDDLLLGLPALFAGTWLGLNLYARLDEAASRKVVLSVLLVSGLALML